MLGALLLARGRGSAHQRLLAENAADWQYGEGLRRATFAFLGSREPLVRWRERKNGAVAQLGEHLLCKQGVVGSIPSGSTIYLSHGG